METTMMRFRERSHRLAFVLGVLAAIGAQSATASGKLVIEKPWIRLSPPGSMMLAGYATLRNDGDTPIVISNVSSADFGSVSMHETVEEGGVSKMRPLEHVEVAPGASVTFAPGGKHFMLMKPQRELKAADVVTIHIVTQTNADVDANFPVRDVAP
jgi:periplasmic copper chaperone A